MRIEYPGAFYHVMHRGNAGSDIFLNRRDREKFLEYLAKAVERFGLKVHTYCLMTNHYHLLLETPEANLSRAVKWINVGYAVYYNRKRKRMGHLFQGRFKAIVVDADEYLKHLSRYIHLNPIRAGMVEHLKDYPWSSYPALSGYVKAPEWLETEWLLSLFGGTPGQEKPGYRDFVESAVDQKIKNPSKDIVDGIVLGGADFVTRVKGLIKGKDADTREKPQLRALTRGLRPQDLLPVICEELGCEVETVLQKGRKKNLARDMAIYLCREMTGDSGVALGRFFGGISGAGITQRYKHMEKRIQRDRRVRRQVHRVKQRIINN